MQRLARAHAVGQRVARLRCAYLPRRTAGLEPNPACVAVRADTAVHPGQPLAHTAAEKRRWLADVLCVRAVGGAGLRDPQGNDCGAGRARRDVCWLDRMRSTRRPQHRTAPDPPASRGQRRGRIVCIPAACVACGIKGRQADVYEVSGLSWNACSDAFRGDPSTTPRSSGQACFTATRATGTVACRFYVKWTGWPCT
ncbi:hypothetical protein ERJ75_001150600 [Trypanosoma vivax]|nr:hypothetical protein ERJ75_001150700 [Trypanosoma vivax]KAH8609956.1 hypothetical protein ERJ75_001150600 [Trypanosoma vivax]